MVSFCCCLVGYGILYRLFSGLCEGVGVFVIICLFVV